MLNPVEVQLLFAIANTLKSVAENKEGERDNSELFRIERLRQVKLVLDRIISDHEGEKS